MTNKELYFLVYKITNTLNNMIYIGIHVTEKINDKYMGSGTHIRRAIKKYGMEKFEKSILYNFDNYDDMLNKEAELVNEEFIARTDTYNIVLGGRQGNFKNCVFVKDKNNNYLWVHKTDSRYLLGELIPSATGICKNKVNVKDKNGNMFQIDKTDPRYLSGELIAHSKGKITVKDKNDNYLNVNINDERYLSGELISIGKLNSINMINKVMVKDKYGNYLFVNKNDPKYLSGELIFLRKDRKHSEKSKKIMSNSHKGTCLKEKNSQYGTCWIMKNDISRKIIKVELEKYLTDGWIQGRKMKKVKIGKLNSRYGTCWMHNLELKISKQIKKEKLQEYLNLGWIKGRK